MTDLALSDAEIRAITGYARPKLQMEVLRSLGIPARRRPDNSVLVMRMHCIHPAATITAPPPQRKSARK
jgi:hypothetical protein